MSLSILKNPENQFINFLGIKEGKNMFLFWNDHAFQDADVSVALFRLKILKIWLWKVQKLLVESLMHYSDQDQY